MKSTKKPARRASRAAKSDQPAEHQHGPKGPLARAPHGLAHLRLVMRLSKDVPDAAVCEEADDELETLRLKLGSKWQPATITMPGSPRQL